MDRPELLPSGQEVAQMVELSLDALEAGDYHPYYLYRQKYMSGSLENVAGAARARRAFTTSS